MVRLIPTTYTPTESHTGPSTHMEKSLVGSQLVPQTLRPWALHPCSRPSSSTFHHVVQQPGLSF